MSKNNPKISYDKESGVLSIEVNRKKALILISRAT